MTLSSTSESLEAERLEDSKAGFASTEVVPDATRDGDMLCCVRWGE